MPYFISDTAAGCDGWATVKDDGEVIGCHTTKQAAIDQMVAVSIAEDMEPGGEYRASVAPEYIQAAARTGLEYNRAGRGGDGLTDQTLREARLMAEGQISDDKIIRANAWAARHAVDLQAAKNRDADDPQFPGAGAVAAEARRAVDAPRDHGDAPVRQRVRHRALERACGASDE